MVVFFDRKHIPILWIPTHIIDDDDDDDYDYDLWYLLYRVGQKQLYNYLCEK